MFTVGEFDIEQAQLRVIFSFRYHIKIRFGLRRTADCDFSYLFRSRIGLNCNLKKFNWIRILKNTLRSSLLVRFTFLEIVFVLKRLPIPGFCQIEGL